MTESTSSVKLPMENIITFTKKPLSFPPGISMLYPYEGCNASRNDNVCHCFFTVRMGPTLLLLLALLGAALLYVLLTARPHGQSKVVVVNHAWITHSHHVHDCITGSIIGSVQSDLLTQPFLGEAAQANQTEDPKFREEFFVRIFNEKVWGGKGLATSGKSEKHRKSEREGESSLY